MVVITEGFPSKREFITKYLDRKNQQQEIMKRRHFRTSSVPQKGEIHKPLDLYPNDVEAKNFEKSVKSGLIETPQVIQLNDEPRYVKNFNEFIKKTNLHLDQILSNRQKIDDVHESVSEIKQTLPQLDTYQSRESVTTISAVSDNTDEEYEIDYRGKGPNAGVWDTEIGPDILKKKSKDLKSTTRKTPISRGEFLKSKQNTKLGGIQNERTHSAKRDIVKSTSARDVLKKSEISEKMVSSGKRENAGFNSSRSTYSNRASKFYKPPSSSRSHQSLAVDTPPLPGGESVYNNSVPRSSRGRKSYQIPVSVININF